MNLPQHETGPIPPLASDPKALPAPLKIPKQIGPYRIEGLLEKGGMSLLYIGILPDSSEPILIKVLSPKYLSNPEIVSRFLNEAAIIAMTDHPNIVKLYGQGQWEGGLYIAMEYIQGMSLRKILAQQPFTLKRALEVILKIAYALCHLHTHGIVHGDLKPENILINDANEVKVIDFGIARMLTDGPKEGDAKPPYGVMGTPIYMSPEQRSSPHAISFQSDIYSLGIIAYELALGRITHGQIHLSLAPKGLQKILNKALQPRAEDRYPDIVDFIADVSSYLHSTDVEKDKQGYDSLYQILESLDLTQASLISDRPPSWLKLNTSLSYFRGFGLFGTYYDFLDFNDHSKGIIIAEAPFKNAEGIISASKLKAIVNTLTPYCTTSSELIFRLKLSLSQDPLPPRFNIAYLALNQTLDKIEFYHTPGYAILTRYEPVTKAFTHHQGQIIQLESMHSLSEAIYTLDFNQDHRWILIGCKLSENNKKPSDLFDKIDTLLQEPIQNLKNFSVEKHSDLIQHKIRLQQAQFLSANHPFCVICLERAN